jgi:hypothetical protein
MKRYAPLVAIVVLLAVAATVLVALKHRTTPQPDTPAHVAWKATRIIPKRSCARPPAFLRRYHVPQPVMIDLSQKRFKGVAFLYGKQLEKSLHLKQWEQYEHFSTYALNRQGDIYLIPTPFISIHPTTFSLQKKLFKLDAQSGKISIFMDFDDVRPTPNNPYGLSAAAFDCDTDTLWVAAIDESDYRQVRGTIYHIDLKHKTILQRIEKFDALSLAIVHTDQGKYLLAGSARDAGLYAFAFRGDRLDTQPVKLLSLPNPTERVRRIKVSGANTLSLQSIPFTYSLVARAARHDRTHYRAVYHADTNSWKIEIVKPNFL